MMSSLRSLCFLAWLTVRRQIFSWKTVMILVFMACISILVAASGLVRPWKADLLERWVALELIEGFFVPVAALAFGTAALGEDRDEKSLIHLLVRPMPRTGIYLAKYCAALPAAAGFSLTVLWLQGMLAGLRMEPGGTPQIGAFWPGILLASAAYVALFQLISAAFRHATAIAVAYAFFIEVFVGHMPGILKRLSIRFYANCMAIDAAGAGDLGLNRRDLRTMLPIEGVTAAWILAGLALVLLAAGAWLFAQKEYREL